MRDLAGLISLKLCVEQANSHNLQAVHLSRLTSMNLLIASPFESALIICTPPCDHILQVMQEPGHLQPAHYFRYSSASGEQSIRQSDCPNTSAKRSRILSTAPLAQGWPRSIYLLIKRSLGFSVIQIESGINLTFYIDFPFLKSSF